MKKNLKLTFKQLMLVSIIALTGLSIPNEAYAMSDATKQIMQTEQKATPSFTVNNSFKLYVNGEKKPINNNFVVVNGRTFLPVREIANIVGISNDNISWEQETQVASLTKDSTLIEIPIGYQSASVNNQIKDIDITDNAKNPTCSLLTNGITYLPLRFLGENLGYKVSYKEATKTIHLYNTPTEPELVQQTTTNNDLYLHPFFAEKGGKILEGFIPKNGNFSFCVDLNGDGKIGAPEAPEGTVWTKASTAEEFNSLDIRGQRSLSRAEISDWYLSDIHPPTYKGTKLYERSQDRNWYWDSFDKSWVFDGNGEYSLFMGEANNAIEESRKIYSKS